MNIEKFKYFIDLIECQNFTETAKINYVSQTTISQQIASLEKELELQLIDRKQNPIKATQAGMLFYEEALIIWEQYQSMIMKMKSFGETGQRLLRIEYSALTDIKSLMSIVPKYKKSYPKAEVVVDKVQLSKVSELLIKEVYDLAVAFDSEFYNKPEISTIPLYEGSYYAAVGKDHPLYNEEELIPELLYQYPLVMLSKNAIGKSYEMMIDHALKDGFEPDIRKTVSDVETELLLIRLENLIGFFPDNYTLKDTTEGIRMIPIKGSHHCFKIVLAYLRKNTDPSVKQFLKTLKN